MGYSTFICYAREDKKYFDQLYVHLQSLIDQDDICIWTDQQIKSGDLWNQTIKDELSRVIAGILLISPHFLASEYIRNSELPILLKRQKEMESSDERARPLTLIPVICRPCLYEKARYKVSTDADSESFLLSSIAAENPLNEPLNSLSEYEQDSVLAKVAKRVLEVTELYRSIISQKTRDSN